MPKKRMPSFRIGRLGVPELTSLLIIYSVSDVFLSYPSRIVTEGATSGWMIPLLAGVIVLVVWLVIDRILKKTKTTNVIESLATWVPFPLISVVLLILSIFILLQTSLILREFTEAVIATVLPNTPPPIVALTFLLVVIYFSTKGVEVISRAALMFMYSFIAGMVLLLVLPLSWFHTVQLLPIWGNGIKNIAAYGMINTSTFYQILILLFLSPALRKESLRTKVGIYSIIVSAVLVSAFVIVLLGTFTMPVTEKMTYPIYQLSRIIYVSRFIQRLEAIFVFIWTSAAVIKMGLGLWFTAYLFAYAQKIPVYRPLIFIFALILYMLTFLPPDLPTVLSLAGSIYETYGGLITILLPVLLVLFGYFRTPTAKLRYQQEEGRRG